MKFRNFKLHIAIRVETLHSWPSPAVKEASGEGTGEMSRAVSGSIGGKEVDRELGSLVRLTCFSSSSNL